jgi:hypothetical protein
MIKPAGFIPRADGERKPPHGSACNRCGVCCMIVRCDLGAHLFGGKHGRCPALKKAPDGFYDCGVITNPDLIDEMREAARQIIYAGQGCDCRINGEPINHAYHRKCEAEDAANKPKRDAALKLWGIT